MRGTVYMIRNLCTGRIYIGATTGRPTMRFDHFLCMAKTHIARDTAQRRDFMQHGRRSFKLAWWNVVDNVSKVERSLIERMRSSGLELYNISGGGLPEKDVTVTDRTDAQNIREGILAERTRKLPVNFVMLPRGKHIFRRPDGLANIAKGRECIATVPFHKVRRFFPNHYEGE